MLKICIYLHQCEHSRIFGCSQGQIRSKSQKKLGAFSPILQKKIQTFFFKITTHTTQATMYMAILLSYYHCILFLLQFNP